MKSDESTTSEVTMDKQFVYLVFFTGIIIGLGVGYAIGVSA